MLLLFFEVLIMIAKLVIMARTQAQRLGCWLGGFWILPFW
jgi:hypothetical protein